MRLQRGKIERERMKHAAEHAFDYTAPPPPKNLQVISQLALPVTSRPMNSQKNPPKSASSIARDANTSKIGVDTHKNARYGSRSVEGYSNQVSGQVFRPHNPLHSHMSPAVAAALAKVQAQQNLQNLSKTFTEKAGAGNSELLWEAVQQNADSITLEAAPRQHQLPAASSPRLPSALPQHIVHQIQAEQDLVEQLRMMEDSNAARQNVLLEHAIVNAQDSRSKYVPSNVATAFMGAQFDQENSEPYFLPITQHQKNVEDIGSRPHETQQASDMPLHDSPSGSESLEQPHRHFGRHQHLQLQTLVVHGDDQNRGETDQVSANSLRQLELLLDFDDNRYGDIDLDAVHSHSRSRSHIIELPNAEIGGSSSTDDFVSSSSSDEIAEISFPENSEFRLLRLKLPMIDHPNDDFIGFQFAADDEDAQVSQQLHDAHCNVLQLFLSCLASTFAFQEPAATAEQQNDLSLELEEQQPQEVGVLAQEPVDGDESELDAAEQVRRLVCNSSKFCVLVCDRPN